MRINEWDVLQLLKNKLIDAAETKGLKLNDSDFGSNRWNASEKRVFYLWRLENNLFERPSPSTVLGTGAEAVRSSAAMIFNLLGEKDIILDNKKYSGAEYEKTFPAIIDSAGDPHDAHLDAVFISKDETEMYAVEAKLLEWNDSPKNLAQAYLNKELYLCPNECDVFVHFFNSLINQELDGDGRFKHKTKRYDAIQMTIHTLGLYNHFAGIKTPQVNKLTLQNVVWKYDSDEYETEETEAVQYLNVANNVFAPLFKEIGIDYSIRYSTFQDFKKRIDFSNDSSRLEYLKRYEV